MHRQLKPTLPVHQSSGPAQPTHSAPLRKTRITRNKLNSDNNVNVVGGGGGSDIVGSGGGSKILPLKNTKNVALSQSQSQALTQTTNSNTPQQQSNQQQNRAPQHPPQQQQPPHHALEITKRTCCEGILIDGYVQSFVDFFYLTHRPNPNPDLHDHIVAVSGGEEDESTPESGNDNNNDGNGDADNTTKQAQAQTHSKQIELSPQELTFLQKNLTTAEHSRRTLSTPSILTSYTSLALYYKSPVINDLKTSLYFYQKCLDVARLMGSVEGEIESLYNLGEVCYELNSHHTSLEYLEKLILLTRESDNVNMTLKGGTLLCLVYRSLSEELVESGDLKGAVECMEKCLSASRAVGEEGKVGEALGYLCVVLLRIECSRSYSSSLPESDVADAKDEGEGNQKVLQILTQYLTTTQKNPTNLPSTAEAYHLLATYHKHHRNYPLTIQYLLEYQRNAVEIEDLDMQSRACCELGGVCNEVGEFGRAVGFFERNFEIVRSIVGERSGGGNGYGNGSGNAAVSTPALALGSGSDERQKQSVSKSLDSARVYLGIARGNKMLNRYMKIIIDDSNASAAAADADSDGDGGGGGGEGVLKWIDERRLGKD